MKYFAIIAIVFSFTVAVFGEEKPPQLKDTKDKASYSFGLNFGMNFKRQNVDVNTDAFIAGFKDAISGRKPLLTDDEVRETMVAFQKEMQEKQTVAAKNNLAEGEKFLAENKTKRDVKTTASGLQYKVIKEGTGPQPKTTDTVTVNYRGTTIGGAEFDSSYKRGEPATFPVTGVIKGWTEALTMMKVGSKYQLFIPANLAYGERGHPPVIGGNQTLIFEVELMEIKPPVTPATSPSPAPPASSSPSPTASPK